MKKTYTPEEIQQKFAALPADIQTAVYGADMLRLIQKVGQDHKLHIDQLDTLEAETADAMTGFSNPDDFVSNLSESLLVDKSVAEQIAKEINDNLFIKIRESMKKTYEAQKEATPIAISKPAAVNTPTPAPAAPAPLPAKPIEMHPADMMLTQKSISAAPATPPPAPKTPTPPEATKVTPKPYGTDPYREPTN